MARADERLRIITARSVVGEALPAGRRGRGRSRDARLAPEPLFRRGRARRGRSAGTAASPSPRPDRSSPVRTSWVTTHYGLTAPWKSRRTGVHRPFGGPGAPPRSRSTLDGGVVRDRAPCGPSRHGHRDRTLCDAARPNPQGEGTWKPGDLHEGTGIRAHGHKDQYTGSVDRPVAGAISGGEPLRRLFARQSRRAGQAARATSREAGRKRAPGEAAARDEGRGRIASGEGATGEEPPPAPERCCRSSPRSCPPGVEPPAFHRPVPPGRGSDAPRRQARAARRAARTDGERGGGESGE